MVKHKSRVVVFIVLLLVISLFKSIYFSHYGFGLLDEGESLHNAQRILAGDIPYRDFFAIFPPADNYFYAVAFKIFGQSVLIPRIIASVIFSFTPVLIFLLIKRFASTVISLMPALLIIFLDVNIDRLYLLTPILLAIYLFIQAVYKKKGYLYFLSGILLGVASIIRLDIPGAFGIGLLLSTTLFFYVTDKKTWLRMSINFMWWFGIGFIIPISCATYWMFRLNILTSFLKYAFIKSIIITKLHDLPFPSILSLLPRSIDIKSLNEGYIAWYAYSILGVYISTTIILLKKFSKILKEHLEIPIFLISGLLMLPYIFGRTDMGHLVKGSIPFLILSMYLLQISKRRLRTLIVLIFIGFFAANIFQSTWWIRFNSQRVVFSKNIIRTSPEYLSSSTTPSAKTLQEAVLFLQSNSQKGQPVLILPYMAGLYFLADRSSPTEFNNVLPGFITTKQEQRQFIKKIKESDVEVLIYDPTSGPKMKFNLLKDYNPIIDQFIRDNFELIKKTPEGWLFMKKV